MTPRSGRPLLPALAALVLLSGGAFAAAPAGTYEIVPLDGTPYTAMSLAFTKDGVRAAVPGGTREIAGSEIDWYETFFRNVRSGATNVLVLRPGSPMRFEKLERQGGDIVLTIAGGGQVTLAESLIDFEKSVREGAMVKLPEGVGGTVQVSRSVGGAWTDDGASASGDEAPASRRGRPSVTRRRGTVGQPPVETPVEMNEPVPEEVDQTQDAPPEGADLTDRQDESGRPASRSPFPRRGGLNNNRPGEPPSNNDNNGGVGGTDSQASGQAVVTISTDYSGPIGGVQLLLQYPPNLQVVEPVAFTGFAGNWLATPNTSAAGQIQIAGAAQPGTSIGGGEFFRVTFVWTGSPPSRQLFRIGQLKATSENASEDVPDFRTTMDVQITP